MNNLLKKKKNFDSKLRWKTVIMQVDMTQSIFYINAAIEN